MNANERIAALALQHGMEVDAFAKIEQMNKGEFVKLVDKSGKIGKAVWMVDGYCACNRGYMLTSYNDVNKERKLVKGTIVHTGFDF